MKNTTGQFGLKTYFTSVWHLHNLHYIWYLFRQLHIKTWHNRTCTYWMCNQNWRL